MRMPIDCPRQRHPVDVSFSIDGDPRYQISAAPSGMWEDGESSIYQRLILEAGEHSLFIGMRDSGPGEGFDFELQKTMNLQPGQHVVVEFDQTQQEFIFR